MPTCCTSCLLRWPFVDILQPHDIYGWLLARLAPTHLAAHASPLHPAQVGACARGIKFSSPLCLDSDSDFPSSPIQTHRETPPASSSPLLTAFLTTTRCPNTWDASISICHLTAHEARYPSINLHLAKLFAALPALHRRAIPCSAQHCGLSYLRFSFAACNLASSAPAGPSPITVSCLRGNPMQLETLKA